MTSVNIAGKIYPADIIGRLKDRAWDERESKAITLAMSAALAAELFIDGAEWQIIYEDELGNTEIYDNSDFCVAGDITDHRDGTVTVKMGKMTPYEELLQGSISKDALNAAYTEGVNSYE